MTPDYFASYEGTGSGQPLPTPGDTPYETPPTSVSRRSSRLGTSPPSSSPPPPLPDTRRISAEMNDEGISILDPRRFTPTLHANLVSEILSLRRELESKHKYIEDVESQLESSKIENDSLSRKLTQSNKEVRDARRQFQQLEHGTLTALEELAKDRDDKKRDAADLREKVETLDKKVKAQEDEATRTQNIHDRDREAWNSQKRTLERRVHVSEARLKGLITELEAQHAAEQDDRQAHDSDDEETRDSGLGNDSDTNSVHSTGTKRTPSRIARHARNISSISQRSFHKTPRMSAQSDLGKGAGLSLADELDFDGEDEEGLEEIDEDEEEPYVKQEPVARRASGARSPFEPDLKAKRVLGLAQDGPTLPTVSETGSLHTQELATVEPPDVHVIQGSPPDGEAPGSPHVVTPKPIAPSFAYVDAAVQYSPPPSPTLNALSESRATFYDDATTTTDADIHDRSQSAFSQYDAEAVILTQEKPAIVVVPTSVQIIEASPTTPTAGQTPGDISTVQEPTTSEGVREAQDLAEPAIETIEMSTQTEPIVGLEALHTPTHGLERGNRPAPIPIPSISIHPASAPPSPRETILPPGTKNVGTQTRPEELMAVRSISIQTDEIRVDRRMMKLPPHLLPSAIRSKPSSPEPSYVDDLSGDDMVDGPTATPRQLSEKALGKSPLTRSSMTMDSSPPSMAHAYSETENRYPGNNDNGPLRPGRKDSNIRRPFRSGSLFAGFDSDTNDDRQTDLDEDIPDIKSAPVPYSTPSFPKRGLRDLSRKPPTPVPEDKEVTSRTSSESTRQRSQTNGRIVARNSLENARVAKRQPSIRRSAMIKGGTNAHTQRSRSPSLQSGASSSRRSSTTTGPVQPPPFPIPNRASSRRIFPTSKSDGAQSPTPRGSTSQARRNAYGQHVVRNENIRKVKSAAVIPRNSRERSRSRSPPAPLRNSGAPPLPQDVITRSQFVYAAHRMSNSHQPTPTPPAESDEPAQATVVDAIAATMVGEWMWKYVRRRKSFNVPDTPEDLSRTAADGSVNVTGNGVRHKRWVWISPYERCVMWSTKQPASGTALLGKSGRKLLIQSVLDVKDDTPLPKNSAIQSTFNRSILILTPARALKFTAVSHERHYLWLTALSFLAHSNMGTPELAAIPPPPMAEPESAPSTASAFSRRAPIRDSVKLTKDKRPPALTSLTSRSSGSRKGALMSPTTITSDEPIPEAAGAPSIPRYTAHSHGRKRSNTGPRIPPAPATLRNFSSPAVPPCANYTIGTAISSSTDTGFGFGGLSQPASLYGNGSSAYHSPRPSNATDASSRMQFADPVGTVRMEAFVAPRRSNDVRSNDSGSTAAPSRMRTGVGVGRARGNTQWSTSSSDPRRTGMVMMDEFDAFDPFRGF